MAAYRNHKMTLMVYIVANEKAGFVIYYFLIHSLMALEMGFGKSPYKSI